MSESARRLARELCGIWFKTVDAIIVRMPKPGRSPLAAQDHAVRKRRWDQLLFFVSVWIAFAAARRFVTVSAALAHLVASARSRCTGLSLGSAALGMGSRKCGPA